MAMFSDHQALKTNVRKSVAAKNTARKELEKWVLEVKNRVTCSNLIDDTHLSALKIGAAKSRGSAGPISTRPIISVDFTQRLQHTLTFVDETTPASRRKPAGTLALELWIKKGGPAPVGIEECSFHGVISKFQERISFESADAGAVVHYVARWIGKDGGRKAPKSDVASCMVVG
jgi:hypothetical protein